MAKRKPRKYVTLRVAQSLACNDEKAAVRSLFIKVFGQNGKPTIHEAVKACWKEDDWCWPSVLLKAVLSETDARAYVAAEWRILNNGETFTDRCRRYRRLDYRYARKLMET